ncbi:hypothetical protein [Streptomyces sp. P17]|uniref:CopG family transcriptional regulator n=2 Tax=Bacteria TaxID=2 RepID=A0AAU6TPT4_UNCXX|nr:hypothetical protein [Streptomyces sp. P17]EJB8574892.1 hypothetical protein [Vibrio parahaemolyticus]EKO3566921.1 hypothetical protein [Vibrio metschnikovii]MDM7320162.1 hypothetical protein [Fervidobacterium sp.]EJE4150283.1 hypothetical protein [Vibrio parahaemolyticus]EKO3587462.1 hypothetical protein [Vibrio metschnikovii]
MKLEDRNKVSRSFRLEPHVDEKLLKLTQMLGVSIHAYIVTEIGKAINRDYLAFQLQDTQKDALDQMVKLFGSVVQENPDSEQ